MVHDLNTIQQAVYLQAISKKWNTEALFCIKRAKEELNELDIAVQRLKQLPSGSNDPNGKMNVAEECIDVLYFIVQAVRDIAPEISLNDAFELKYNANWINKKKTVDSKGSVVLR